MANMRTYGVIALSDGTQQWVEVTTDTNGYNDLVYLTTLCQVLQLNLGESPFYGNYGIPVMQSLQNGVPPDLYVARVQSQFSPFFAALTIQRGTSPSGDPVYNISVLTNSGSLLSATSTPLVSMIFGVTPFGQGQAVIPT